MVCGLRKPRKGHRFVSQARIEGANTENIDPIALPRCLFVRWGATYVQQSYPRPFDTAIPIIDEPIHFKILSLISVVASPSLVVKIGMRPLWARFWVLSDLEVELSMEVPLGKLGYLSLECSNALTWSVLHSNLRSRYVISAEDYARFQSYLTWPWYRRCRFGFIRLLLSSFYPFLVLEEPYGRAVMVLRLLLFPH